MADAPVASRPLLILDIGGVLLTDPMPILFGRLAQAGERPRDSIYRFYLANLRNDFWAGRIAEDEFWSRLLCASGLSSADARDWRTDLISWQRPLPALAELPSWSARADVEILSNHRSAWVRPAMRSAGVALPEPGEDSAGLVRRALVSQETGLVKPEPAAFLAALSFAEPRTPCLFVDDQPSNVAAAEATGLPALLADPGERWMADVEQWLESGAAPAARGVLASGG